MTDGHVRRRARAIAAVIVPALVLCVAGVGEATYSIVALDPETGEIGVAVQSRAFNVGMAVPWVEAGVGAIATQASTNESFGPRGLALLRSGLPAQAALEWLLDHDEGREVRQVGIIDAGGRTAQHTGAQTQAWAGGITGENFACQGNILAGEAVVGEMARAFEETEGALAVRLLAALAAAENAGGDSRGKQSAALLVGRPSESHPQFRTRYIDLRVDDHPEPIEEIHRLYRILEGTDLVFAHIQYAAEYEEAGETAMAKREIDRISAILEGALGREETSAGTLNALAWYLATNETNLEGALTAAKRAVAQEPETGEILDTLAEVYFRLGRYDDAVRTGAKALGLSPDDAYLRAQLKRFESRRTDLEPGETDD